MKRSIKVSLVIIVLVFVACVVVLILRSRMDDPEELIAASDSSTSGVPSFAMRVIMPRMGLPLGGILPDALVEKFDGTPSELRLDHTSAGAQISSIENNGVEISADGGWALSIETDGAGRITQGTHLVFPLGLGGNRVRLDCRPADPGVGNLETITRPGSDELSGRFLIELAKCKNAESGKTTDRPPAPLTVRGIFAGLRRDRR